MSNPYFDWPASASRFVRFDTVRAADINDAFDAVSAGFDDVTTALVTSAAASVNGTSTTSVSIGTGTKNFTASTGKGWAVGQILIAVSAGTPTAHMVGQVASYNSSTGALALSVASASDTSGSGSYTDWNIGLCGKTGATATLSGSASGGINLKDGGPLASAATLDPWTASLGNQMTVTSGTTITGFAAAPQAGAQRELIASGALQLTAGANVAIQGLASGETITLATGDVVHLRALTTTTFRCTIEKANGDEVLQTSKSVDYTCVLADANRQVLHPSSDATPRTFTIPANSSVAYKVGTYLTFVNGNGAGSLSIAITTDTMRLAGAGTTGTRTLAANGVATAFKIGATEWYITGVGLT